MSLFRNQFNIFLCVDAANVVLRMHGSFASFKMVPSDASNNVEFNFSDLALAGPDGQPDPILTKQILTYNMREDDAMKVVTGEATLSKDAKGKMPDFAAFLCGFNKGFAGSRFEGYLVSVDAEGPSFMKSIDGSGLPVAVIEENVVLSKDEIAAAVSNLDLSSWAGWGGVSGNL
jgi:hypothetical protein